MSEEIQPDVRRHPKAPLRTITYYNQRTSFGGTFAPLPGHTGPPAMFLDYRTVFQVLSTMVYFYTREGSPSNEVSWNVEFLNEDNEWVPVSNGLLTRMMGDENPLQ